MRVLFDILLVVISTLIIGNIYKNLVSFKNLSMATYVIFICYVFNCIPVLLDLCVGRPEYVSFYSEFDKALQNDTVSIVYDLYILVAMLSFYVYSKKIVVSEQGSEIKYSRKLWILQDIIIISPLLLYLIFVGDFSDLLLDSLIERNRDSNAWFWVNNLLFISLYFFCIRIFGNKKTAFSIIWLLLFLVMLTLVSGKRFIVAVVLIGYLFSFICSQWKIKRDVNLTAILLIVGVFFMAFIVYYITNVKVMGDYSNYIYSQLRIDFGRDDVTKFVLMREMEGQPILEYRGESVLSLLLMIVPRFIWPAKPYPHYRYLTAELYGITPDELQSGMTPSIFEMMVANFGYLGMIIAIAVILSIVYFGDRLKNPNYKLISLIVLIQLFTQSLDVILILFYFFLFMVITKRHWLIKKSKSIKRDGKLFGV